MLVEFYTKCYKKIVEVVAWLILILGVVAGGIIGAASRAGVFPGAIFGFIVSAVSEALFIPPLMILFQIDSKLEKISVDTNDTKEAVSEDKAE